MFRPPALPVVLQQGTRTNDQVENASVSVLFVGIERDLLPKCMRSLVKSSEKPKKHSIMKLGDISKSCMESIHIL